MKTEVESSLGIETVAQKQPVATCNLFSMHCFLFSEVLEAPGNHNGKNKEKGNMKKAQALLENAKDSDTKTARGGAAH